MLDKIDELTQRIYFCENIACRMDAQRGEEARRMADKLRDERALLIELHFAERDALGPGSPLVDAQQQGAALCDHFTIWGRVKKFARSVFSR